MVADVSECAGLGWVMMLNEKKVISLFSGAGGMDIGFTEAGFKTVIAVEEDPSCCNTLRLNNPGLSVIEGDISYTFQRWLFNRYFLSNLAVAT